MKMVFISMKKVLITTLWLFCCITIYAQSIEEDVVRQFGNNLRNWCSTKDIDYRMKAQKQCADACRVKDKIMEDFVANSGLNIKDYVVPNYLNGFEEALGRGAIVLSMTNVRIISKQEQSYTFAYGTSTVKEEQKRAKDIITVACDITVSGSLNYPVVKDLFYIKKGKIAKILPYEEEIDQKTGKKKVKVDFSDLEDTSMLGFSINYDQNFPIGASIIGQYGWFMCSSDFGFNLGSKKYVTEKMNITNIMNYSCTRTEYEPKMYLTITPAVFLKYISVGCGVGLAWLDGNEETSSRESTFGSNGSFRTTKVGPTVTEVAAIKFMLRPQIKGYIPLTSSCNMSLGVGYDFIPKMKDLNGYHVSIGFHFDFEDWDSLFIW